VHAPRIPAIVLAAGRSSRMGEPKAALRLPGGATFVARIARELTAGGAAPVLVVVSGEGQMTQHAVASLLSDDVRCVVNPEPCRGQLSSLQCGLLMVPDAPAVVVTLVDVPLVSAAIVHALIHTWATSGAPLVRPTRAGRHGHPMLIAQPLIAELLAADPPSSARDVVRRYAAHGVELHVQEDGPFLDVDTPEEYGRLVERLKADT
jgi:molybdenum cofactor cytidylyltransferase